ncbi:hypothetical protein CU052_10750 [Vibrio harveyi]|uniref:MotA/TolQ/ExbB proton channel family protein n=1 Tax=Vibrio harveyi TaxID=669 RepID=UPI000C7A09E7|nr:MotA/TolQ/ExbB proton channel family protein [Vibrio harveyi]AWA99753.1 hypothetical protein CU052_10750 [Vibrio harveyi]
MMKSIWLMLLLTLSWQISTCASELDDVLNLVQQGTLAEKYDAEARVKLAIGDLKQTKQNLKDAQSKLEKTNQENLVLEDRILQLQESLKQRRNQYQVQRDSMSGVFKHVAEHGDLMLQRVMPHGLWNFDQSGFIQTDEESIDIAHIRRLWLALLEQTILSGKVLRSEQTIILIDGTPKQSQVTQYGPFNAYTSNLNPQWLHFLPGEKSWMVMDPQPELILGQQEIIVDPSFGVLLDKQANTLNWLERLAPAGIVGVLIIMIGLVGAAIAAVRSVTLRKIKRQIYAQMTETEARDDNALGRVMLASEHCKNAQLESVIDEAVLKEVPTLKVGVGSLAVFASIPPLLGLLGTVGGMIETFRVITENGSADSQLLSGGISQALLTTEMGLIVAVPLLLLHCGLKAQSTHLIEVLEQQSAGLIVMHQQLNAKLPYSEATDA